MSLVKQSIKKIDQAYELKMIDHQKALYKRLNLTQKLKIESWKLDHDVIKCDKDHKMYRDIEKPKAFVCYACGIYYSERSLI